MEFMRSWIISVTVSAMIIAVAEGMMPPGTVKRVGKLVCGLVLMLGIIQPIARLDYDELFIVANGLEDITIESELIQEEITNGLLKSIIEQESAAYVLDKAETLGIACTVTVSCESGEDDVPIPNRATVRGALTSDQEAKLSKIISEDLGIPKEQQTYINEEVS